MSRNSFILLLLLISCPVFAADFTPGQWEFSVRYTISGMPAAVPTQKFEQCLTEANPVPTVFLQASSCDVLEQQKLHRTLHYKVNCFTRDGTLVNEGEVRFSGGKARGKSKSDLGDVAGRNSVLRYKFTGRYIGACQLN